MMENIVGIIVIVLLIAWLGLYIYQDSQIQKDTYEDI